MIEESRFITDGDLTDRYKFVQFKRLSGSEHRIGGEQYALLHEYLILFQLNCKTDLQNIMFLSFFKDTWPNNCMSFIHYNSKYGSFKYAVQNAGGLA